jgi:type IV pilus assembly protein PilV
MSKKPHLLPRNPKHQHGFSMIEVLVTMLIVALALLGTSGLLTYAMRQNQGGQFRTQAVFLSSDLAERMEANRVTALAGGYDIAAPTVDVDCSSKYCTGDELATSDLFKWSQAVAAALPQGTATPPVHTTTGSQHTYTITISWVDRQEKTTQAAYSASAAVGANATGTGERFSYTATRTFYN